MKVMTIMGTRPEIIRLSRIIPKLDKHCENFLIFTGQNYDEKLSNIFFRDLGVRQPDINLDIEYESLGEQISEIFRKVEKVLIERRPEKILILGDTTSGLSSIIAKRLGIKIYHMEAGNRCFDDIVPEEVNRRVIDQCSDILMPYTKNSKENLIAEGFSTNRIFVIGNPIFEVIDFYSDDIENSNILNSLNIKPNKYFLITMHRAENVDNKSRLKLLLKGIDTIQKKYSMPIVVSTHPRTRKRLEELKWEDDNRDIKFLEPLGFFDFVNLERNTFCVLTDSGTVQEECCIFGIPNVTIRDVTERPETIESGSNILSGVSLIEESVKIAIESESSWTPPEEYLKKNVSDTVIKILLGY